jgi:threonine/homoserine/homoserine lactone efflux protein
MASMVPGLSFALVFRNVLRSSSRIVGIMTAIGLALGMAVYVGIVVFGLAYMIIGNNILMNVLKYSGALYLAYIGFCCLGSKAKILDNTICDTGVTHLSNKKSIMMGFFTNVLNPKVMLFFLALFTQFVKPNTPRVFLFAYGSTSVLIELLWFSLVAIVLTNQVLQAKFYKISHWIERLSGIILLLISVKLVL